MKLTGKKKNKKKPEQERRVKEKEIKRDEVPNLPVHLFLLNTKVTEKKKLHFEVQSNDGNDIKV